MSSLTRVYESEQGIYARYRNVLLVAWRGAPTPADVDAWHRLGTALAREHPDGTGCIDVIVRGTPQFSEETRKKAEALARDPIIFDRGIVHTVLLPGLGGTAVRAFIHTIILVSRAKTPATVTADVPSAAAWLAPRAAPGCGSAAELGAATEELIRSLRV